MVASMGETIIDLGRAVYQDLAKFKDPVVATVVECLQKDGSSVQQDVGVLMGLAAVVLVPATLIRPVYAVSVGYAFAVALIGSVLLASFPPSSIHVWMTHPEGLLCVITVFHGLRLGSYIFLRESLAWQKFPVSSMNSMATGPRLFLTLSVSFLYALMTLPLLTTMRHAYHHSGAFSMWTCMGTAVALVGAVLEATADFHKHLFKQKAKAKAIQKKTDEFKFCSPVTGLYGVVRHPNYLSEMIFWLGIYIAGVPSYQTMGTWLAASVGFLSLLAIMLRDGTPRLEKQQQARYGGIKEYEEWKRRVPHVLVPGLY